MAQRKYWPSIDHSLLSPSGRMSKRARTAALKREGERLFAGLEPIPEPTDKDKALAKAKSLRRHAANLLDLAQRGMKPRAFPREAAKAIAQAETIEKEWEA